MLAPKVSQPRETGGHRFWCNGGPDFFGERTRAVAPGWTGSKCCGAMGSSHCAEKGTNTAFAGSAHAQKNTLPEYALSLPDGDGRICALIRPVVAGDLALRVARNTAA